MELFSIKIRCTFQLVSTVLCTPEKVYWGWKSEVKPIPVLRGMGRIAPLQKA